MIEDICNVVVDGFPTPANYFDMFVCSIENAIGVGGIVQIFELFMLVVFLYLIFKSGMDTAGKLFLSLIAVFSMAFMGFGLPGEFIWIAGFILLIGAFIAGWAFTKALEGN